MKRRVPLVKADEYDGLTRARRQYLWRPGELRKLKCRFNRRERRTRRADVAEQRDE